MIHKNRCNRRFRDKIKAIRKKKIAKELYTIDLYDNLNQYSKNKIHCSCPRCSEKTNTSKNKSKGQVDRNRGYIRLSCTNHRYGKKNYRISDLRNLESMLYQTKAERNNENGTSD